ncbi:MAG TPA: sugar ABC transporter ATP-binding protein [Armatimonadota bacterium]
MQSPGTPDSPPLLAMRGITKRFGATTALDGVDFEAREGEVHALVGENGSGKSTLMYVLAGALRPDEGTMTFAGEAFRPRNPMDARRRGVAMIHQELSLCGHLSVTENVLLGMEDARFGVLRRGEMKSRCLRALDMLGYGHLDPDVPVRSLPIAIRQVAEIARAVAIGCRVVVLDEPTSSLSERDAERLFDVIAILRSQGHAIVYISHFMDEIQRVSDRLTVLRDGKMIGTRITGDATPDDIVTMMVGRKIDSLYPRSNRPLGEPLLQVAGLAGVSKPESAGFVLHRGEVLGIAGLNGSGRTELLRALFGLDAIRRGEIRLGVHIGWASPARRWAQGAGLLSEDRKLEGLALPMSIADNVTLSSLHRMGTAGTIRPRRQNTAAAEWIRRLDIRCLGPQQPVRDLSGGNQQKVALARLLLHGVDVLLLDEPTRGIDVGSKEMIYRLIDESARDGKAILMVSSYLPELMGVCDRIAVMHKGELGAAVPVDRTTAETLMREATGS